MSDPERNARAYLVLIVDTRQDSRFPTDYRRVCAGIFSDEDPSTANAARYFSIMIASASGPSYQWCRDQLMALVDDPTRGLQWLKPLMQERTVLPPGTIVCDRG